jgi:hypothetical protein
MKSINPNADYLNLHRLDATILNASDEFKNDLGQSITFFEDPTLGDESFVWVAFPEHSVAFLSDFFETDDMTTKFGDIRSAEECVKNGYKSTDDTDYVPRLRNGKMILKFYDEEPIIDNQFGLLWADGTITKEVDGVVVTQKYQGTTPKDARELLDNVRRDLDVLVALGESYAHFQSAQATHKYLKKAKNALEGIS